MSSSTLSRGRIELRTGYGYANVEYREHDTRNGTLLVELSGSPVNAEQLRVAADLLEKEEADLRKGRAIYQAAASNLLVHPALEYGSEEDVDEDQDLSEIVREQGELLASQEWDSGGPGAGAGVVELYEYDRRYYVFHDAGVSEYDDPLEALASSGIATETDATTSIWISLELGGEPE